MPQIFISYRRADSQARTEQIYLRLIQEFGEENVFLDVEPGNIPEGEDFRRVLRDAVQRCDILLVIIGDRWVDIRDSKNPDKRRLDNQNDFVRIEVEAGLNSNLIRTIPVLIDQTSPVEAELLPETLQELAYKQAVRVRGLPDFHSDMGRLIAAINRGKTAVMPTAPIASIPYRKGRELPNNPNARKRDFPLWSIAAGIALIGVLVFAVYMLAIRESDGNDKITPTSNAEVNQPTEDVTEVVIAPTETASPTRRPTNTQPPTATFSETEVEGTIQGEMLQVQTEAAQTAQAQETATAGMATGFAQQTRYAQETAFAYATETATLFTLTPTIDTRKTAEARITETQIAANQTATATLWTNTPTSTFTPSITPSSTNTPTFTPTPTPTLTPTLTEREKAILLAEGGVASNTDWTPYGEPDAKGVRMMLVPKGSFIMGSEDGASDEQPAHRQEFDEPFWIDQTEVTRADYQACVEAGVCEEKATNRYSDRETQPVNYISWSQARGYCEWRGGRLPTEREWEYAARGPESWVYPWGNEFVADSVVFGDNSNNETSDVGSRPGGASWVGALDLSGNLWEWVSTIYTEPYPYSEDWESNTDTNRVRGLRGGSFFDVTTYLRSAYRNWDYPIYGLSNRGFRCARS